jgi:hypothetical protein
VALEVVRTVVRRNEWQALESRNNQVIFLGKFAEADTTSTWSTHHIGRTFNVHAKNPRQIRHIAHMKRKNPQLYFALDPEREASIVLSIHQRLGLEVL